MSVEARLLELGIELPPPPPAVAAYEPWMRTGNLILTSGQLPWKNGELTFSGKCGAEITEDQGYQAARQCAINAISQLKAAAGDLGIRLVGGSGGKRIREKTSAGMPLRG